MTDSSLYVKELFEKLGNSISKLEKDVLAPQRNKVLINGDYKEVEEIAKEMREYLVKNPPAKEFDHQYAPLMKEYRIKFRKILQTDFLTLDEK